MKRRSTAVVPAFMLLVLAMWPSLLPAQAPKPPSLEEQLRAQFESGTVLTIQKQGVLGVALSSKICPARYQDGKLNFPDASCAAAVKPWRALTVGEKVNPSRVDVDLAKERISFGIVGCDSCNKGTPSPPYKSQIDFQFAKGYLETAGVSQIVDTISDVLAFPDVVQEQPPQPPPQPGTTGELTNSDVVKMVKAKLGDGIIISKIKSSPCNFDTSVDALVNLKEGGVSDPVIQAMQDAGPPSPPLDVSGRWTATSTNSQKSREPVSLEVDLEQHPDGSVTGSTLLNGTVIEKGVGTLQGDTLNYTSTRIITSCPGTFTGTVTFAGDSASGHYEGRDCQGTIQDGTISMSRAQDARTDQPPPNSPGAGHYVSERNAAEYLDLGSDGKFFLKRRRDFTGSYEISGDTLTLRYSSGQTSRFKLDGERLVDGVGKNWVRQGELPPAQAPAPVPGQASFSVRHRHRTGYDLTNWKAVDSYCSGTLSISPDGTVAYDCTQTDDQSGRCEHLSFAPGALKQAKIGSGGNLHLESKTQGKFDFSGDQNDIKQALAAITPLIQATQK